mgnify:CR=1 FL=1
MGIINLGPYETSWDTTVQNSYISLARARIIIHPTMDNVVKWRLSAPFKVWGSKDERNNNYPAFNLIIITKNLNMNDLNENIFKLAYDELKLKFTNTQDDL